jgi:subfamily B ATP-binding cassette protein MsbA
LFRLGTGCRTTSKIQKGLAGCDRVFGVLDTSATIVDRPGAVEAKPLREAVAFEGVGFTYGRGRPVVLHDINLRVPAGRAVAIVGETGSGKSTLVNLLPRFYDPTAGRLTWDGTDLRDLQVVSLRDRIALITQDVVVFDATIAENISYGRHRDATRDEIVEAAKAANAHRFIEKLPHGYDTLVGAHGTRLSGGERQRIAIARAILKDAPVMILDEATSSLDSETEALIQEALARVMKGRTVFVIAHRLSTIQKCDEIYVMDAGRFVEHGTHGELLARNGQYARYHAIQFGKRDEAAAEVPAVAE